MIRTKTRYFFLRHQDGRLQVHSRHGNREDEYGVGDLKVYLATDASAERIAKLFKDTETYDVHTSIQPEGVIATLWRKVEG